MNLTLDGLPRTRVGLYDEVHIMTRACPDDGACHHECGTGGRCWRVENCGPLSGVFPDDDWPETVISAEGARPSRGHL